MEITELPESIEVPHEAAVCVVSALSALTENWRNRTGEENIQAYLNTLDENSLAHFEEYLANECGKLVEKVQSQGLCNILIRHLEGLNVFGHRVVDHLQLWWTVNWNKHSNELGYPIDAKVGPENAYNNAYVYKLLWHTHLDPVCEHCSEQRTEDLAYAAQRYELAELTLKYFEQYLNTD